MRAFLVRFLLMAGVGVAAFAAFWLYSVFRKPTAESRLAALQTEVAPQGGQIFRTELAGKSRIFLLLDCTVSLLDVTGAGIVKNKVLSTGFYFGLDVCTGQSIGKEGEYLTVHLANRAIGAGGGNTSGGSYRSKDGVTWEKHIEQVWRPVSETQQ